MSRIDPSRQVSMSAARAASPGFTEGQNIKQNIGKTLKFMVFAGEGGGILTYSLYIPCRGSLYILVRVTLA